MIIFYLNFISLSLNLGSFDKFIFFAYCKYNSCSISLENDLAYNPLTCETFQISNYHFYQISNKSFLFVKLKFNSDCKYKLIVFRTVVLPMPFLPINTDIIYPFLFLIYSKSIYLLLKVSVLKDLK